jgi:hypothetical protein
MSIAAAEPTNGELASSSAERHAPAVASRPLTLKQLGQICQVCRAHGPSVNGWDHEREATADADAAYQLRQVHDMERGWLSGCDRSPARGTVPWLGRRALWPPLRVSERDIKVEESLRTPVDA